MKELLPTPEITPTSQGSHSPDSGPSAFPHLASGESTDGLSREDLEDRYLDLKDEVWRLRKELRLDQATGQIPIHGGYASAEGYLNEQRVAVFVDAQNIYYAARRAFQRNVSYAKMLRRCVRNRRMVRAIAYVFDRPDVDATGFFDHLRYLGIEVKKRERIERIDGSSKAAWELGMAMDILRLANSVDAIVVVSGNGVFADLAEAIRAKGCRFECCTFRQDASLQLLESVDRVHILDSEHLHEERERAPAAK